MSAAEELLRLPRVRSMTGLSQSELYRRIASGDFPKPLKRGRTSVWPLSTVSAWIEKDLKRLAA